MLWLCVQQLVSIIDMPFICMPNDCLAGVKLFCWFKSLDFQLVPLFPLNLTFLHTQKQALGICNQTFFLQIGARLPFFFVIGGPNYMVHLKFCLPWAPYKAYYAYLYIILFTGKIVIFVDLCTIFLVITCLVIFKCKFCYKVVDHGYQHFGWLPLSKIVDTGAFMIICIFT